MIHPIRAALFLTLAAPAFAQRPAPVTSVQPASTSWQHAGSDLPADPAWRTGTLANGLRFAVRRNATPPGQVSIRVRVDVGGLDEADAEQGWSHLIEHMVFRGTAHYPDGEGIRLWQRLGASFGADTNASTTLTATTYQLDLPRADPVSLDGAMGVLAEMMSSARLDPALLDAERRVVLAERAARFPPLLLKVRDQTRPLLQSGLLAERRDVIGDEATLAGASADRLAAFYHRWYRPSRTVVVVVGDADPARLEAAVRARFGDWRGSGPEPATPDYGALAEPARPVAVVSDPQAPDLMQIAWERPHDDAPFTLARQQRQYEERVAVSLLNKRLQTDARSGGAIVNAAASLAEVRHQTDSVGIVLVARPGARDAALRQLFAIVNAAAAGPPTQAELDQEIAETRRSYADRVAGQRTATSPALASGFIRDVDQGDVSAAPETYRDLFDATARRMTPATVQAVLMRLLAPPPRLVVLFPTPVAGGEAAVTQALAAARQVAGATFVAARLRAMAELILPGRPARVTRRVRIADLGIERVWFSNGVELRYKRTAFERDRVRLTITVGHGVLARPPGDPGLFWTAAVLGDAGLGPFSPEELARMGAGRQLDVSLAARPDAVLLGSTTNGADVPDVLRLMTGALTQLRWAPGQVTRLQDQFSASYQTLYSQPGAVLQAFGAPFFYGGDTRFRAIPPPAEVSALTLAALRAFWRAELARGPIVVEAVGELDGPALERAVAASLGTLPRRVDQPPGAAALDVRATPPPGGTAVLRHRGAADQAAIARVWPTLGARENLSEQRALGVAAALIETRLLEEFRGKESGTYTPFAAALSVDALPHYGVLLAGAQVSLARRDDFGRALDRIVADLAANGPDADALARARMTQVSAMTRAQTTNGYWLSLLGSPLDDPRQLEAARTAVTGRQAVDATAVKAVVAKYLTAKGFVVEAVPPGK